MTSDKKIGSLIAIVLLVALYVFLFMLDNALAEQFHHRYAGLRC